MKLVQNIRSDLHLFLAKTIQATLNHVLLPEEMRLERPPKEDMGDFAFPCFELARVLKKNPVDIAKILAKELHDHKIGILGEVKATGPYINFFLDRGVFASVILKQIAAQKHKFGSAIVGKHHRVIIEYSSPNTNKPQHIGHVRNDVLGYSLSLIMEKLGYETVRLNLINDRGIHIMKSMLAYEKWGDKTTPRTAGVKGDHFVGQFYVMFGKEHKKQLTHLLAKDKAYHALEGREKEEYEREMERKTPLIQEAQQMLQKWEAGDKHVRKLWKQMNGWAISGLKKTYKDLEVHFDDEVLESDIYREGKNIVEKGLSQGTFEKLPDGRVLVNLEDANLPNKTLLRADGTSLYMTQDLYLAVLKFEKWKGDISLYVVASEQDLHFKQLFAIMKKLGYPFANDRQLVHCSYGMVRTPSGRLKSREGSTADADDIIEEIVEMAREKALESKGGQHRGSKKIAQKVGIGALKFFMLGHTARSDITYNPKETIALEGYTGPFIQYAHARIYGILKKARQNISKSVDFSRLTSNEEYSLMKHLALYPEKVHDAARAYDPSVMANYLFELAQKFNTFYHAHQIIQASEDIKRARLLLASCTATVLKDGLHLLGIDAPEQM